MSFRTSSAVETGYGTSKSLEGLKRRSFSKHLTLREARRVVEERLYTYALIRMEYPGAPISQVYEDAMAEGKKKGRRDSQEEQWVLANQRDLQLASAIEQAMRYLTDRQRKLVEFRYIEQWSWRRVAEQIGTSERDVYEVRNQVIMVFAYAFGLWETPA
jgi:DNA-directed RNA polymerase specialized sigma subunit